MPAERVRAGRVARLSRDDDRRRDRRARRAIAWAAGRRSSAAWWSSACMTIAAVVRARSRRRSAGCGLLRGPRPRRRDAERRGARGRVRAAAAAADRRDGHDRLRAARRARSPACSASACCRCSAGGRSSSLGGIIPIVAAALVLPRCCPSRRAFSPDIPADGRELRTLAAADGASAPPDDTTFVDRREQGRAARLDRHALRPDVPDRHDRALARVLLVPARRSTSCFSWLTSLLTGAGFDPGTANTGITAFNLGGVAGALLGGWAIARFGSRRRC